LLQFSIPVMRAYPAAGSSCWSRWRTVPTSISVAGHRKSDWLENVGFLFALCPII
jgi:hypothetical protein